MAKEYQAVIGIETHVQLRTKSKLFCSCSNDSKNAKPNTNLCPVCLGLPGSLPVLNKAAVDYALQVGLLLNAKLAKQTKFDRKNYFYPDLPKGYQITQYDQPIVGKGYVELPSSGKKVGITRAHLEEDAGKLVHHGEYSLVDLNRAGTPLMEIVSEPDISTATEAKEYAQELYNIMRYGQVSDVDLYHGNMRFDVNVSVQPKGSSKLGTRSETKNLNSFRAVEKAAEYEIKRQIELLERGEKVVQETRGWDESKGKTFSQRSKEDAHDYRYFPEPDLPPLVIKPEMIKAAEKSLPATVMSIRKQLSESGISADTVKVLASSPDQALFMLELAKSAKPEVVKGVAKYMVGKLRAYMAEHLDVELKLDTSKITELHSMQSSGQLSSNAVDEILIEVVINGKDPKAVAESKNLVQVSDSGAIAKIVDGVVKANLKAVEDYKKGNGNSLQFLVGQVMKESKGQANPQMARDLLEKRLQ